MTILTPYKNRSLNPNKSVKVYKNLHNGLLSVQQDGKVIGHASHLVLTQASFKVNETGRQRVIAEKHKNVHAFIVGMVSNHPMQACQDNSRLVSYNPYKYAYFYFKDTAQKAQLHPETVLQCSAKHGVYVTG